MEQEGLDILDGLHGIIQNATANLVEGDDSSTSLIAVLQTANQLQNGHGLFVDLSDVLDQVGIFHLRAILPKIHIKNVVEVVFDQPMVSDRP